MRGFVVGVTSGVTDDDLIGLRDDSGTVLLQLPVYIKTGASVRFGQSIVEMVERIDPTDHAQTVRDFGSGRTFHKSFRFKAFEDRYRLLTLKLRRDLPRIARTNLNGLCFSG